ncbi:MAG: OmpP1/FadL family transporter [Flavicella sp.]
MKYLLFLITILASITSKAQILGYNDLGLLFSQENYHGTARFNAMAGAFGALGGDVSATYINPAGGAVFNRNQISGSLSSANLDTDATYYGTKSFNNASSFRNGQFGAAFIFDTAQNSDWSKTVFGVNYSVTNDFKNNYRVNGNNGVYGRYNIHPFDSTAEPIPYNNPDNQTFTNITDGKQDVYSFSLSSAYQNLFYLGAAINFHNTDFRQSTFLNEVNSDGEGNTLYAEYYQQLSEVASGISVGLGIIVKPIKNLRLGIAYQSPVWNTEVIENSNAIDYDLSNNYEGALEQGELEIYSSDINDTYYNAPVNPEILNYVYAINTPSKFTASFAYIFDTWGLISIDYSTKDYSDIKLQDSYEFSVENNNIQNSFARANTLRVGGELRVKQFSFRGGAFLEESPLRIHEGDIYNKGLTAGLGLQFNRSTLDFAYEHNQFDNHYNIYTQGENINPASLNNTIGRFTATLSIQF